MHRGSHGFSLGVPIVNLSAVRKKIHFTVQSMFMSVAAHSPPFLQSILQARKEEWHGQSTASGTTTTTLDIMPFLAVSMNHLSCYKSYPPPKANLRASTKLSEYMTQQKRFANAEKPAVPGADSNNNLINLNTSSK